MSEQPTTLDSSSRVRLTPAQVASGIGAVAMAVAVALLARWEVLGAIDGLRRDIDGSPYAPGLAARVAALEKDRATAVELAALRTEIRALQAQNDVRATDAARLTATLDAIQRAVERRR
jgi:hypothetical protein